MQKQVKGKYWHLSILFYLMQCVYGCAFKITSIKKGDNSGSIIKQDFFYKDYFPTIHFLKDDYTILEVPALISDFDGKLVDGKMMVDQNSKKMVLMPWYYCFKKNEKMGVLFFYTANNKDSIKSRFFCTDSIANYFDLQNIQYSSARKEHQPEILIINQDEKVLKFPINDRSVDAIDSVYFYFNRHLNKIPYSLSNEADSINGMKLYKQALVLNSLYNETKRKGDKPLLPKDLIYEFYLVNAANEKELHFLFKEYKRQMKK